MHRILVSHKITRSITPLEIFRYAMCRGVTRSIPSSSGGWCRLKPLRCSPRLPAVVHCHDFISENTPILHQHQDAPPAASLFVVQRGSPQQLCLASLSCKVNHFIDNTIGFSTRRINKCTGINNDKIRPSSTTTNCQPSSLNRPSIRSLSTSFLDSQG